MVEERRAGGIAYTLTVKNVKNVNLRVKPDGAVCVSASRRVPKGEVDGFVAGRAEWIAAHQARLQARRAEVLPPAPEKDAAGPILAAALERVYPLVQPLGVKMPALKPRRMKSRWGSCHYTKGVVVMNTALAALPEDLQDYVTLHELCHFLHPNHGAGFHALMAALMPDWKARRKRLRGYEGMLGEGET